MANVLHRTRDPVDYRPSVHTPNYDPAEWFINPDTTAVIPLDENGVPIPGADVPKRYWSQPLTDPVTEMTAAEKTARDAALAAEQVSQEKMGAKQRHDDVNPEARAIRAIVKLTVDELNILRAEHGLAPRTYAQARSAIQAIIDGE